jgi:hypothetical protein
MLLLFLCVYTMHRTLPPPPLLLLLLLLLLGWLLTGRCAEAAA